MQGLLPSGNVFHDQMHHLSMNILPKSLLFIWNYCAITKNVMPFIVLAPHAGQTHPVFSLSLCFINYDRQLNEGTMFCHFLISHVMWPAVWTIFRCIWLHHYHRHCHLAKCTSIPVSNVNYFNTVWSRTVKFVNWKNSHSE